MTHRLRCFCCMIVLEVPYHELWHRKCVDHDRNEKVKKLQVYDTSHVYFRVLSLTYGKKHPPPAIISFSGMASYGRSVSSICPSVLWLIHELIFWAISSFATSPIEAGSSGFHSAPVTIIRYWHWSSLEPGEGCVSWTWGSGMRASVDNLRLRLSLAMIFTARPIPFLPFSSSSH